MSPACPLGDGCGGWPGYPADYHDPPWDGSEQQFRDIVIPARLAALEVSFNAHLDAHGITRRIRWKFGPTGGE